MASLSVAVVDIAVAEFDRSRMRPLGHDLSKVVIEYRNGMRQQYVGLVERPGGGYKTFRGQRWRKAGRCGCFCGNNPTIQSFPCQGNSRRAEALMHCGNQDQHRGLLPVLDTVLCGVTIGE